MGNDTTGPFLGGLLKTLGQRSFFNSYAKTFETVRADTPDLREQVFRLRYDVYCLEHRFLQPADFIVDQLERDAFDKNAIHHLLIHKPSGEAAGTLRVLLPDRERPLVSFELQRVCDHPLLQIENRVLGMCEISRFCMSKRFRSRPRDGTLLPAYYEQEWDDQGNPATGLPFMRRRIPYAPLGLLRAAFDTALENGVTNCIAALETRQFYTVKRLGMIYRVLGPRLELHGMQQPITFNIKAVLDNMHAENPECWEVVSDKGRLSQRAGELYDYNWQDTFKDEACRDMILRTLV